MAQQISPFIEAKYGWGYGADNWDPGMDENLLKFSFMFDGRVDGVVGSLPAAVNGQSYFLTTDNRFYFAVGTTWYSSPCPQYFVFKVKSTGDYYQFDGSNVVQIDSPAQAESRFTSIEATLSSLGTAAFEDVADLATQAELDVASAQANAYTDSLRSDIADDSDPAKGAAIVGRGSVQIESIEDFQETPAKSDLAFSVKGVSGRWAWLPGDSRTADGFAVIEKSGEDGRFVRAVERLSSSDRGAVNSGTPTAGNASLLQSAVDTNLSPAAITTAGDVQLSGETIMDGGITVSQGQKVSGIGAHNASVLKAADDMPTSAVVTLDGSFGKCENFRVSVPATCFAPLTYDPESPPERVVDAFSSSGGEFDFGNILRDVRASGGRHGFDVGDGLETHLFRPIAINSWLGFHVDAYDTSIFAGITQDNPEGGLLTKKGVELTDFHAIRSGSYAVRAEGNLYPVSIQGLFVDTPTQDGVVLDDIRGATMSNLYTLRIGNNLNSDAVAYRFTNNSRNNALTNGRVINAGTNYRAVFEFEGDTTYNNSIAFFYCPDANRTVASSEVEKMRRQTVVGCTGDAARYNNVPRFNRGRAATLAGGATASIALRTDWDGIPGVSNSLVVFTGMLVARSISTSGANTGTAYADFHVALSSGYTNNAESVVRVISDPGEAISTAGVSDLSISNVSISAGQLLFDITNNNATAKQLNIAFELRRSVDANGLHF